VERILIDRKLGWIVDPNDFKPGDIILTRGSAKPSLLDKVGSAFLHFFQSLIRQKHGHFDTNHAAICIGFQDGQPLLAHVINNGIKSHTAITLDKAGYQTPFWVYRPRSPAVAKYVAKIAAEKRLLEWSLATATKSFFKSLFKNSSQKPNSVKLHDNYISSNTLCSKFVIEVLQEAALKAKDNEFAQPGKYQEYFPSINSDCLPKTVEAYFYRTPDQYQMLCHTGRNEHGNLINPYTELKKEILVQLQRINVRKDEKSQEKAKNAYHTFKRLEKLQANSGENQLDKAIAMARVMLPLLNVKTGFTLSHSISYKKTFAVMKKLGIFKRDVESYTAPESLVEKARKKPKKNKLILASLEPSERITHIESLIKNKK
jgi:hypothetical protein